MPGRTHKPITIASPDRLFSRLTRSIALCAVPALTLDGAHAAPTLRHLETSMEYALVSYDVRKSGHGRAMVHDCPRCTQPIRLVITPQSRLFRGDIEMSFRRAPKLRRQRVTLFHQIDTNIITRIIIE